MVPKKDFLVCKQFWELCVVIFVSIMHDVDSLENRICSQVQLISDCKQVESHTQHRRRPHSSLGEERRFHERQSLICK